MRSLADPTERLPARATIPPSALWTLVEGQVVILESTAGRYYSLDDVGTRLWLALSRDSRLDAAMDELLATYEVDAPQLCRDIASLLEDLARASLVTIEE
jgi:hypothetical protein